MAIFLPRPPKGWDRRCVLLYLGETILVVNQTPPLRTVKPSGPRQGIAAYTDAYGVYYNRTEQLGSCP